MSKEEAEEETRSELLANGNENKSGKQRVLADLEERPD
jgi:hypothetical protein